MHNNCADELFKASHRLGLSLRNIKIIDGVAKINIIHADNFHLDDIKLIRAELKNRGATSLEIDTGNIMNKDLLRILEKGSSTGSHFHGEKVMKKKFT